MKDRIRFHTVDSHVEILCCVCKKTFQEFPGFAPGFVNPAKRPSTYCECPHCKRGFYFSFQLEPMELEEVQKREERLLNPKTVGWSDEDEE